MRKRSRKISGFKPSISLQGDLYERALQRARLDGRNFSNYIQRLITEDLARSNGRQPSVPSAPLVP